MEAPIQHTLEVASRKILRPLVRILLRAGVPCGAFFEQVKRVYVEVGGAEFGVEGRNPSISRTAVITGLTRKDVSRLWKRPTETGEPVVERYNRAARVISGWVRDERFSDARGGPASLAFQVDPAASGASFSELVSLYSGDMPPRAVLDELIRVGAVAELKSGKLRLIERAYVPATGDQEKLTILGTDVAELLATIDHNLTSAPEGARFQRKVSYDNLPVECLASLQAEAATASQALLENLDRKMAALDRDASTEVAGTGRATASIGIYFYQDVTHDESEGA